ncbi:hypothetical protein MIS45_02985 [Wielerella bovis]|uniref:hypothetical protein n=1 Tax=Wielerella bovis TaxID=2917790 RepID=UPI002018DCEC|nr:hypothetical protein [Wielerella bovis]ULJ69820.1 hypothetical protein MIS45_02985 [Wielerella bovis]
MINLYQILNIPPHASVSQIQAALQRTQAGLDPKTIKAVNEWLLVHDVRVRYDAKLRQEQPDFFMITESTSPQEKPKIVLSNSETENDDDYMDLPPLWNPKAAMWWSVFFNVVLGAVLHAKNWESLGEKELAKQNWIWAGIGAVFLFIVMVTGMKIGLGVQIGLVVAWYYALGKKQVLFFEEEFNNDYERKGWLKPILLTIIAIFVAAFVAVLIAPE